jgi:putative peptidoglycan lipid II flippase
VTSALHYDNLLKELFLMDYMGLIKNSATVGGLTLVSRVFGYIRDMAVAFLLGAGPINDAFIIAFRIPNLFRSLFAEGAFTTAFIPLYSSLSAKSKKEADAFAKQAKSWLALILIVFTGIMLFFMPAIVALIAPGYIDDAEIFDLTVTLARLCFPYVIFLSFVAFYGGILNSHGRYFVFAASPILLNITLIVAVFFAEYTKTPAHALSVGVFIAGVLQLAWVMFFAMRCNLVVGKLEIPKLSKDIRKLLSRMAPSIMGSGVIQLNVFINSILASYVVGGVSYIYYADRIYQLPLAIIGTAVSTVLLPVLAKEYQKKNMSEVIRNKNSAIEFCSLFTIPATLGIMVLSYDIIEVLFEHGAFTAVATLETAKALTIFALGLPAYVFYKVLSSSFFAKGDTRTPVKIGVVNLLVGVIISLVFLPIYKHVAIAMGSAIASWFCLIILVKMALKEKIYKFNDETNKNILKMFASSLMMVVVVMLLEGITSNISRYISMTLELVFAAISYGLFCYLFGVIKKEHIAFILPKKKFSKKV